MRYIKLIIACLFLFVNSHAQLKSVETLVSELNNSDFIIDHTESRSTFQFKSSAAVKLEKKGKKAACKLLRALDNDKKDIAAHIVLCKLFYGKVSFAGPKIVTENDLHVNKYFIGKEHGEGLVISEVKTGDTYKLYIDNSELERIKNYWKTKTGNCP